MSLSIGIATYFVIWWVVLFAVLPFGITSQHESGSIVRGADPAAPVAPHLVAKAIWTTLIATILFGVVWFAMRHFG